MKDGATLIKPIQNLPDLAAEMDSWEPEKILAWAFAEFSPDIALACSFGGVSGMVLLDMAVKIDPKVTVFYLDTDYLFPETYALVEATSQRYGVKPIAYKSRLTPEEQARQYGEALWRSNPDLCCQLRKVEPNGRALEGQQAWISGIRRDQTRQRQAAQAIEWDAKFELFKVNPLVNWTEAQVWNYIARNQVPYNQLHDWGYPSLGCVQCTRAVKPGEDPRAGRWANSNKTECGLHYTDTAKGSQIVRKAGQNDERA